MEVMMEVNMEVMMEVAVRMIDSKDDDGLS